MKTEEKKQGCYLSAAFGALIIVALFEWLWPDVIPFTFFQFWELKGDLMSAILASWPIFAWCIGVTLLVRILTRNPPELNRQAEQVFGLGCITSGIAGVFEEISFRWLIFYNAIIVLTILNFLLFGIPQWFYLTIIAPVANFFTFGALSTVLFGAFAGWVVGAAVISSNGRFRDGHVYLGPFGWVNAWFIGMFFFWLMFNYGLIACIVVHFLYDLFIDVIVYIDSVIERRLDWA